MTLVFESESVYVECFNVLYNDVILIGQKKPSTRPLSASRVSTKTAIDTEEEASAVLEAMKAENEQASKLKKETPRKLPPTPKQVLPSLHSLKGSTGTKEL